MKVRKQLELNLPRRRSVLNPGVKSVVEECPAGLVTEYLLQRITGWNDHKTGFFTYPEEKPVRTGFYERIGYGFLWWDNATQTFWEEAGKVAPDQVAQWRGATEELGRRRRNIWVEL